MITNSVIIYLNYQLEVYSFEKTVNELKLLEKLQPTSSGRLELANRFMQVWQSLDSQPEFVYRPIFFWIGPRAGFTDTRIVFIWLKTKFLMQKICNQSFQFFLMRIEANSLTEIDLSTIIQWLELNQIQFTDQLLYSSQPRIGITNKPEKTTSH